MENNNPECSIANDTVKAGRHLFDEMRQRENGKTPTSAVASQELPSKAKELHVARKEIDRLSEQRRLVQNEATHAMSKLLESKDVAEDLSLRIRRIAERTRTWNRELLISRPPMTVGENSYAIKGRFLEVTRELEALKWEIADLKLSIASLLEAKVKAKKDMKTSRMRMRTCLKSIDMLGKEIDEADSVRSRIELARLDAIKETKIIEAQRKNDLARFTRKMKEAKAKIKDLRREIRHAKKLEKKLLVTNADLYVLRREMENIWVMEGIFKDQSVVKSEGELEVARKELASIKDKGFQQMASIDSLRREMENVSRQKENLKRLEGNADAAVQKVSTNLLQEKFKLDLALEAEKQAQAAASNLTDALQNLESNIQMTEEEREESIKEIEKVAMVIRTDKISIISAKDSLMAVMQKLQDIKLSETAALDNLRVLSEKISISRASSSLQGSNINMTLFEYEYLRRNAKGAREIASKKVEAAKAWVEAIHLSEKEIILQTEAVKKEILKLKADKKKTHELGEKCVRRQSVGRSHAPKLQIAAIVQRKSIVENNRTSPSRRSMAHRVSLTGTTCGQSPSVATGRRKKTGVKLVKFLRGK